MQDKIFRILFEQDDVTWQSMLYELVRQENMNPWDINVSELSKKYISMLKNMKALDFRITGKVVLAAALLLRFKSSRLVGEDMDELDRLMAPEQEEDVDRFYDDIESEFSKELPQESYDLMPRTPQPRKRKISIYDLVSSLQKALEVKERRVLRNIPAAKIEIPEKGVDISSRIRDVYSRITDFFKQKKRITFSDLVPSNNKENKVYTFIPLLHLSNHDQRKIDMKQEEHFGEIEITAPSKE